MVKIKRTKIKKSDTLVEKWDLLWGKAVAIFRKGKLVGHFNLTHNELKIVRKEKIKYLRGKKRTKFLQNLSLVLDRKTRRIRKRKR